MMYYLSDPHTASAFQCTSFETAGVLPILHSTAYWIEN